MKLLYVPVAICVPLFICRLWGPVHRLIGYVTEAETHQAADVEVIEMHQCEWEHKGVLKECQ